MSTQAPDTGTEQPLVKTDFDKALSDVKNAIKDGRLGGNEWLRLQDSIQDMADVSAQEAAKLCLKAMSELPMGAQPQFLSNLYHDNLYRLGNTDPYEALKLARDGMDYFTRVDFVEKGIKPDANDPDAATYPIVNVALKISQGAQLNDRDNEIIDSISKVTGISQNDLKEYLRGIFEDTDNPELEKLMDKYEQKIKDELERIEKKHFKADSSTADRNLQTIWNAEITYLDKYAEHDLGGAAEFTVDEVLRNKLAQPYSDMMWERMADYLLTLGSDGNPAHKEFAKQQLEHIWNNVPADDPRYEGAKALAGQLGIELQERVMPEPDVTTPDTAPAEQAADQTVVRNNNDTGARTGMGMKA